MRAKRAKDLIAAFVVGNGVLDTIAPRRRAFLWAFGPIGLRKLMLWFADHPTVTRLQGIASVGIGIWLALRQYREAPRSSWRQRWSTQYRVPGWRAPVGLLVAIPLIMVLLSFWLLRRRTREEAAPATPAPEEGIESASLEVEEVEVVPPGPPSAEEVPAREEPPPGEERPERRGVTPTSPPTSRQEPPPGEERPGRR